MADIDLGKALENWNKAVKQLGIDKGEVTDATITRDLSKDTYDGFKGLLENAKTSKSQIEFTLKNLNKGEDGTLIAAKTKEETESITLDGMKKSGQVSQSVIDKKQADLNKAIEARKAAEERVQLLIEEYNKKKTETEEKIKTLTVDVESSNNTLSKDNKALEKEEKDVPISQEKVDKADADVKAAQERANKEANQKGIDNTALGIVHKAYANADESLVMNDKMLKEAGSEYELTNAYNTKTYVDRVSNTQAEKVGNLSDMNKQMENLRKERAKYIGSNSLSDMNKLKDINEKIQQLQGQIVKASQAKGIVDASKNTVDFANDNIKNVKNRNNIKDDSLIDETAKFHSKQKTQSFMHKVGDGVLEAGDAININVTTASKVDDSYFEIQQLQSKIKDLKPNSAEDAKKLTEYQNRVNELSGGYVDKIKAHAEDNVKATVAAENGIQFMVGLVGVANPVLAVTLSNGLDKAFKADEAYNQGKDIGLINKEFWGDIAKSAVKDEVLGVATAYASQYAGKGLSAGAEKMFMEGANRLQHVCNSVALPLSVAQKKIVQKIITNISSFSGDYFAKLGSNLINNIGLTPEEKSNPLVISLFQEKDNISQNAMISVLKSLV